MRTEPPPDGSPVSATHAVTPAGNTYPCSPLPPLIPPFRHCMIEDALYRGAHPSLKNMRFMRRLHLRTVLSLVPDAAGPSRDLRDYCASERIRHVWHFVEKYDDSFSHTPALVASLLSEMVDPRNHPLYIHCRDGAHNTGIVVMCLRRLQNWGLPTIFNEFMRYTKSNLIAYAERRFVESFHATVSIPVHIPRWLWDGVRYRNHPSIQLYLELDPNTPACNESPTASVTRDVDATTSLTPIDLEMRSQHTPDHPVDRSHRCKHVELRYSSRLAALDLHGVHLLKE